MSEKTTSAQNNWTVFKRDPDGQPTAPHDGIAALPPPPPWRAFDGSLSNKKGKTSRGAGAPGLSRDNPGRGRTYQATEEQIRLVNAALYLRRPLLITGKPGVGKSALAYAVAYQLKLGPVLRWSITSRSTLTEGLYRYDAIGRLQEVQLNPKQVPDISKYLRLGPLGTALLPSDKPRVLLIDEIDKSDIDLPNDLLNIFEEGEYEIPELARLPDDVVNVRLFESEETATVKRGKVQCHAFPFVALTNNGEREFPPPFLRRCLRLDILPPDKEELGRIVEAHLGPELRSQADPLIDDFLKRRTKGDLATDQLLNAVYLIVRDQAPQAETRDKLIDALLKHLGSSEMV